MQIIYINNGMSPDKFSQFLKKYNNQLGQQSQKYNQLLMEGFIANGQQVHCISSRPINRKITSQKFFKAQKDTYGKIDYYYVPFFNIKGLRELSVFLCVFFKLFFKKTKRKETAVICDALNVSATAAALLASFFRGFDTVGIVTDVPGHYVTGKKLSFNGKINLFLMKSFKKYLLLTKQMNSVVNPKKRPYVVLEGHSDISMKDKTNELSSKHDKKVCLYAGALQNVYGLGDLVNGFIKADIENAELHIYGIGDYANELKQFAEKHNNIKYFGAVPNKKIVEEELKATLLINPRPTNEDYTKYSFPSKNMEYMASGTPVLTTNLPGMPKEYLPYVYLIEEENIEGIKNALCEVLSKSAEELHSKGKKAKEFVMNKKNNVVQAKKVLEMLQ